MKLQKFWFSTSLRLSKYWLIFKKVGYKHGNWHDTRWFQLSINDPNLNPPPPKTLKEIISSKEFMSIIHSANNKIK
jgi:hypothetical protein